MFPGPYFAATYFPGEYFPKFGQDQEPGTPSVGFDLPDRQTRFDLPDRQPRFDLRQR